MQPVNAASSEAQASARAAHVSQERAAGKTEGTIVCFGDSLTAGFGVGPGKSYPDLLQTELDRLGYSYQVINEGVSGDTTNMGLVRTGAVVSRKPDVVVVCFGGNDGLRALAIEGIKSNLSDIIAQIKEGGAEVVLAGMKLPPNYGSEYTTDFENAFRELAEEQHVAFLPFLLEGVGGNPAFMQGDGIHPNVEGNRRVAKNVLRALEPLLDARRTLQKESR